MPWGWIARSYILMRHHNMLSAPSNCLVAQRATGLLQ